MHEFELIDWIKSQLSEQGRKAIGDDAAVLPWATESIVVATDMIVAGTHFLPDTDPRLVGRKALAVNLSDMAAMAVKPKAATVALAIPNHWTQNHAQDLLAGLLQLASQFEVDIVGGDTTSTAGPLTLSVTIWGEAATQPPIMRSGARPGDRIYVGGLLGKSLPTGHHLSFEPQLQLAALLAETARPTAMIDVSDGLINDLSHITEQSGVGALLNEAAIPRRESATTDQALHDGEDFVLCFCVPAETPRELAALQQSFEIGEIRAESGIVFAHAPDQLIPKRGFVHGSPT